MGLFDKLASIFKPNVGSDAEPSSWASSSTYTIPAASKATGSSAGISGSYSKTGTSTTPSGKIGNVGESAVTGSSAGISGSYSKTGTSTTPSGKIGNVGESSAIEGSYSKNGGESAATSSKIGNRFEYSRPSEKLSDRARRNGLAKGEDYDNITQHRRSYIKTYYDTLDRAEVTKPYLELEAMLNDRNTDASVFGSKYQELMDYLDAELEAERKENGRATQQYRAIMQVKNDVSELGRQFAVNQQFYQAEDASRELDKSINSIFAGIMNTPGYDAAVNSGRNAVSKNTDDKKWFDKHMANASETQRNLMYYTYEKEGMSGVQEMFNRYMGDTLNTLDASKDFVDDLVNNPGALGRFWEATKAAGGTMEGWLTGARQTFTDTESNPNDRELVAGYTTSDAVDHGLRNELGTIADTPEFQQTGEDGFLQMRADGVSADWYLDATRNATALQRQVLGNMYLSTDRDAAAAEEIWKSIKETDEQLWNVVNGANTLPYDRGTIEGQMYRDYLGMSGKKSPSWLSNGSNQTMAQLLWDATATTVGQVPQVLGQGLGWIASLIPGIAPAGKYIGMVAGSTAMSVGAYGNAYKEARDQGYSKERSGGYAAFEAASEFLADMLFSGVGKYGGLLENKFTEKALRNISGPITRVFAEMGINMASEGSQEFVQELFEPVVRNILLGEDNKFLDNTDEARYNFFMGAVSALALGGLDTALGTKMNLTHAKIGAALNAQESTAKLVDTVLNTDPDSVSEEQRDTLKEAQELAEKVKSGEYKANDVNAGELLDKAAHGGVDVSFLQNPETVTYTKEQLTVDDLRAGALSRLATLGGNTALAEDVAKLAKGQTVSEDTQSTIQNDPVASQVLEELQGELDMDNAEHPLTIAAHMSTVQGTMAKLSQAVHENNPDKVILTQTEEYIKNQGVGLADAQKIGAVFNKVLDGKTITREDAALVQVKSPAIQGSLLALLDIDLASSARTDAVLKALNEKAAEVAKVKDMQAGVREATKARAAGSGKTKDSQATKNAKERRRRKKNGTAAQTGTGVQTEAAGAEAQAPVVGGDRANGPGIHGTTQTGRPGEVQARDGGDQIRQDPALSRPRPDQIIPVDKLNDTQKQIQQQAIRDGFASVIFANGVYSRCEWNDEIGGYELILRADGQFTQEQYLDHETGHLWLKALSEDERINFMLRVLQALSEDEGINFMLRVRQAFGEDFDEAFAQVKEKYTKAKALSDDVSDYKVIEEMYCFARGGQDFTSRNDSVLRFDFSKYRDAMLEIEKTANLQAMAMGDMSNEQVRKNYESGNFGQEYYAAQGYLDTDFAPTQPKTEEKSAKTEKKPTIPPKKKGRSAEEKAASIKRDFERVRDNFNSMTEDSKAALTSYYEAVKGFIEGLKVGDIIRRSGFADNDVYYEVTAATEDGIRLIQFDEDGNEIGIAIVPYGALTSLYGGVQFYQFLADDSGHMFDISVEHAKSTTEKRTEAKEKLDEMAKEKPAKPEKKPTIPPKSTTEKRAEAKEKLDKMAEEKAETKTEKKKSKSKKATIPSKAETEAAKTRREEEDELRKHYQQRKDAQTRKFNEGRLKITTQEQLDRKLAKLDDELQEKLEELSWFYEPINKNPTRLTVTPEAIARADHLSEETRSDLLSEVQGLQAELKSDPAIADNPGFQTRVKEWFEKADRALDEANTAPAETNVSPARAEFLALVEQLKADPSLEEDEDFRQRIETAMAVAAAEMAAKTAEADEQLAARTEQLADAEEKLAQQEAAAEKPAFNYDEEFQKLTDEYQKKRAAQLRRKQNNPQKSWDSYNAKLRDLKDKYDYDVQALKAKARRNGDTRFSVDADDNMEVSDEQIHYGGNTGRKADDAGRGRVQALAGGEIGAQGSAPDDRGRNGSAVGLGKRRCEAVGILPGQFLEESQWTARQRAVAERLYDAGFQGVVLFRRTLGSTTKWIGQSWFENGVPTVAICVNGSRSAEKVADHEAWHLWLRSLKGDKSHGKHKDFVNFILGAIFDNDPVEFSRLFQSYREETGDDFRTLEEEKGRKLGWSFTEIQGNVEADIMEEIFCDLASGQIYEDERLDTVLDLIDESGVLALAQGDYDDPGAETLIRSGYLNTEYATEQKHDVSKAMLMQLRNFMMAKAKPLFSLDTDNEIEDLMDRRDEMRSDYNEAQAWDIGGKDESGNVTPMTMLSEEGLSANDLEEAEHSDRLFALLEELKANPDREQEIMARVIALQNQYTDEASLALMNEEPEKPKAPRQKKAAPKPEPKPEQKKSVIPPAPKPEPAKVEAPAPTPAAFDVALADVAGPVNVAGLTLGKAKDKVYQARTNERRRGNGSAESQAKINQLTEQYDKIQALIAERGQTLANPNDKYNLRIEGQQAQPAGSSATKPASQATEKSAAAKAFKPNKAKTEKAKVTEAKAAPKTEEPVEVVEVSRPEIHRGENPVDVEGLSKKKAIEKVTREKAKYETWYNLEKAKFDKLFDDKVLNEKQYAQQITRIAKNRNKDVGRYDDQLKRLNAMEAPEKNKPTVVKDETVTYSPKTGKWWGQIKNADTIQIRRLRSDRNTYDVRFTDSKGKEITFDEVPPAKLKEALSEKQGSVMRAKELLTPAYEAAEKALGEWQTIDNTGHEKEKKPKTTKPDRALDNYGRKIPVKLYQRMENSTVRDSAGRLLSVYRLGPANGVRNANPNTKFTLWSERPATMNLMRGLNGAAAYDQEGKGVGADIEKWLTEMADHPGMSEANKNALRDKIAIAERNFREYTTHVTRLDPFRPGYTNPNREDVIGGRTLLEGYVDIRNPLVVNAEGKGMDFVNEYMQQFVNDPHNLAGETDVDGDALGEHDGVKFINVNVTNGDTSLGGGKLDRDTIYATLRANQAKSTYNTNPSDSELMQYSLDPDSETGYAEGTLEDTILKIMRDKDEAHAIESLANYLSQFLQTGVLPQMENEKTRNIFQRRITPAEEDYLKQRAADLIQQYGRLEPGEKPARDVAFPRKTEDGNIRRVFRTAAESSNTPERAVPFVTREAMIRDGATYQPISDKSAIDAADSDMQHKGFDQVLAEWRAKVDGSVEGLGAISKYDIAKGEMAYIEAVKVGDMETAMQTLAELAEVGTTAGQVVQAMRMLKNMPKSYQLYYMRRVVNRMNRQYAKRIDSGRMSELKIDKNLARAVLNAQTQEELDQAMENLIKDVASQIPSTISDKWNAWRYLSMLGNPKTHIRNLLGNAIFAPAKFSKDIIAAGLEGAFIKNRSQRRTSLKGVLGKNAEYRAFAKGDYEGIKEELQSGGKYNPANEVMNARTIFSSKALEFLRTFNGDMLEKEDGAFLKYHYVNALTDFLATQGMSVRDLTTTRRGQKLLNAARQYAFNEAQKATYRDASRFASALNQMKRDSGAAGILLEGIFPFTKTPINILKRGVEYSPIGLLKTASYNAMQLKQGKITANDFIDNMAAGLTGTGIAALGMWLASMGWLRGGSGDDDKQDEFDKLQGYQDYSITIGDHNFTIDWTAPGALPLFVGCELFNQLREGNEITSADFINALTIIAEPITQLSMLSGLNETLKSAKWDDHPTSSVLMSMGSGYITQALPTLVAQISRSLTPDRRTTFVDKNSGVPQPIQRWWQTNVLGKTPLNAARTEYIDAWGRKDTTSSFVVRLFENLISPGYINRIKTTPVDAELQALAERVGSGVLMTAPERTVEFNNESHHLTAKQYQTYAKTRGDSAMQMLSDLFNSEGYQDRLSDSEKAYAVKLIKDYANAIGKKAVFDEYDPTTDNWAEKCDGDPTRITNTAILKARAHEMGITVSNNTDTYSLISSLDWLTPTDRAYLIAQQYSLGSTEYVQEYKGGSKYGIDYEDKQILAEHFRQIFPAYFEELAATEAWQNANVETRVDMLSDLRATINADNKAWLAGIKDSQNAPYYQKKTQNTKYGLGNIYLNDRDTGLYDRNGNLMTLNSISFWDDSEQKEILIPTVVKVNGQWTLLSESEAIDWYYRTGEYLGKFRDAAEATSYAQKLHEEQEQMYAK